jgi:hypothetical protein
VEVGVARKKKEKLPTFAIVDMPKWKSKICDIVIKLLFPGEKYFVLTIQETSFEYDGKDYYDLETGEKIDLSN